MQEKGGICVMERSRERLRVEFLHYESENENENDMIYYQCFVWSFSLAIEVGRSSKQTIGDEAGNNKRGVS